MEKNYYSIGGRKIGTTKYDPAVDITTESNEQTFKVTLPTENYSDIQFACAANDLTVWLKSAMDSTEKYQIKDSDVSIVMSKKAFTVKIPKGRMTAEKAGAYIAQSWDSWKSERLGAPIEIVLPVEQDRPEAKAEPKPEAKAEPKPEAKAEPKPEAKAEAKPAKTESKPAAKKQPAKTKSTAQAKPKTQPKAQPEQAKPEAQPELQPQTQAQADQQPPAQPTTPSTESEAVEAILPFRYITKDEFEQECQKGDALLERFRAGFTAAAD